MNEESTDILARKQNIFVFFSKLKRWNSLQLFKNFIPNSGKNKHKKLTQKMFHSAKCYFSEETSFV